MVEIALILSSWNRPNLMPKTVDSILRQTFTDWRLYVIENSNLPHRTATTSFLQNCNDKRVNPIFVHDRQLKIGEAYNMGIDMLKEEQYVMFCSDDVILIPNKLELLHNFLLANPDKHMVCGILHVLEGNTPVITFGNFEWHHTGSCVINLCQPMMRRRIINEVGKFRVLDAYGATGPDADYFSMIAERGYKLYSVQVPLDITQRRTYANYELWLQSTKGGLYE